MTSQAFSSARVLIAGASGMVGGEALRVCLASDEVTQVTVIGRRSLGVRHAKLIEIVHEDASDYSGVRDAFREQDAALFCIGVYTGSVPDDVFRRITVDFAVAFGEALAAESPGAALSFLSGQGAEPTGKARMAFARYKGEAETALSALGLGRLHVFRPGYIYPVEPRDEPNLTYRVMRVLYPALKGLMKNSAIPSDALAQAMVKAALEPGADAVLENDAIRRLAGLK